MTATIHVLHENPAWLPPLAEGFRAAGVPWTEWFLDEGLVDLGAVPPEGVFYNRMSASSHTRGHRHAAELTSVVLAWLERHGRRVVNGSRALDLEISKIRQYTALERAGLATPRTIAVVGEGRLVEVAAQHFGDAPFVLKPNRGGKGLGVRLFTHADELAAYLDGADYTAPLDGVHLLQAYIRAAEPVITRAEFVGGRFLYAVEVDTSDGFELCPADACALPGQRPKFRIVDGIERNLQASLERFLAQSGIEIAGIEFIRAEDGAVSVYDVNTNTNYNAEAEAEAGLSGPRAIADFLGAELQNTHRRAA
jgi:glutathione synthase/RimK-type ligase-like ATP-grasp enzyme